MIKFNCPNCEAELEVSDQKAGAKVACPECGHRLIIPAARAKSTAMTARQPDPEAAPLRKSAGTRRPVRREKVEAGSNATLIIVGAVGGGLLLAALLIGGIVYALRGKDDKSDLAVVPVQPPPINTITPPRTDPPVDTTPPLTAVTPPEKKEEDPFAGMGGGTAAGGEEIYQYVLKSVVWILVPMEQGLSSGSGTLVDKKNRLILTNHHVVHGGRGQPVVFFPLYKDGKLVSERDRYIERIKSNTDLLLGKVVRQDEKRDLALIQVDSLPEGVEPLKLASGPPSPGANVYSIGSPGVSGALWLLTPGTVRQVSRQKWQAVGGRQVFEMEAEVIESTSPINSGDSGGPLVNDKGEQVGVAEAVSRVANSLSLFVSVNEASNFVRRYCQSNSMAWPPENTRAALAGSAGGASEAQVPQLIRALSDPDATKRARAAQYLGKLGPGARLAISPLLKALKDSDDTARRTAADALLAIGAPSKDDLRALKSALKDTSTDVRLYAAGAVGKMGPDGRFAAADLVEALSKDTDAGVRQAAARSLAKLGADAKDAAFPALVLATSDSDRDVGRAAAEALSACGPLTAADVPPLLGLLKSPDVEVRALAARALGKAGNSAKPAVPSLLEACKSPDAPVRRAALGALVQIGPDAKSGLPVFTEALKDGDTETRKQAAAALGKLGVEAKPAVSALAAVLKDTDKDVRRSAAVALGKVGTAAKEAVPALADVLRETDKDVLLDALDALAAIGPDTKATAVGGLIALFENRDAAVRTKAAEAAGKIKAAVPRLITALSDNNNDVRATAAIALGNLGPDARSALKTLATHAQRDLSPDVQLKCAEAVRKIQR